MGYQVKLTQGYPAMHTVSAGDRPSHLAQHPVRRLNQWGAISFGTLAVIEIMLTGYLVSLNNLTLTRLWAEYVVYGMIATLGFTALGILIMLYRAENNMGLLFGVVGIGNGLHTLIPQYLRYVHITAPQSSALAMPVAWLLFWLWMPIVMLSFVFPPLLFPDGKLPSRQWRPVLGVVLAITIFSAIASGLKSGPIDGSLPQVANPFATSQKQLQDFLHSPLPPLILAVNPCIALVALVWRFRHSGSYERQQLKWYFWAGLMFLVALIIPAILSYPNFDDTLLSGVALAWATLLLTVALGIAIFKHNLYAIDWVINRTLVYGLLTFSIMVGYIAAVGVLSGLFHVAHDRWVSLVVTGMVAVLFQPLRAWLQGQVNRLLYGDRDNPYIVLAQLGQRLEATLVPAAVLPTLVATIKDALKLPYVAIALQQDGVVRVVAEHGAHSTEVLALPLTYQGEIIGELQVSPRDAKGTWLESERQLLADVANQAGMAVYGVQLTHELQRARERLVLAREEERRRLRHDLHDDLAPTLAALALTAATAEHLLATNPPAAVEVIQKLHQAIRATVADIRRLVYELRPPTLDELGLVGAIREYVAPYHLAAHHAVATPSITLEVAVDEAVLPLPAAVEVAAFRIVQEAVNNIIKHAHATACTIHLSIDTADYLRLEVRDNGVGLPAKRPIGVGLRSMHERAEELGGSCDISALAHGGTSVAVLLPILNRIA